MTKRSFQDVEEDFLRSLLPKRVLNAVEMERAKERIWKRIQNTISETET